MHRSTLFPLITLFASALIFLGGGFAPVAQAVAQEVGTITIERPGERDFIVDGANLLTAEDTAKIKEIADKLLTDKAAPIIVVTINSMSDHSTGISRIETFARLLFDQWGVGPAEVQGQAWNYGILLVVSKYDRRARIELGAGWRRDKDAQAQQIMDELIIPHFKQDNYSAGILAGVEGLDKMARDLELPSPPFQWQSLIIPVVFVGLLIFTVVSLIRRGSSGWAWLFWGAVFTVLGLILYYLATNRGSGGGGGFSGGSFGGGFSGGGGASGSW